MLGTVVAQIAVIKLPEKHAFGLKQARPLDLAIASDIGLIAVERALLAESRRLQDAGAGLPPVPQDAAP